MQFNNYVWNLYANSDAGKKSIEKFKTLNIEKAINEYDLKKYILENDEGTTVKNGEIIFWLSKVVEERVTKWTLENISDAQKEYTSMLHEGLWATHQELKEEILLFGTTPEGIECWSQYIKDVSVGLYLTHPKFFLPYLFQMEFYLFQQICETFTVNLPKIPKKQDNLSRGLYYLQLCQSLYEFRMLNNLNPCEMCAFLYDFAPHFIEDIEGKQLPKPSKASIIKGGVDNGDYESLTNKEANFSSHWQGNIDTRRGDILVFYFLTPQKKIHYVARAKSDGFYDPYFHYHSTIWIESLMKVPEVEFNELNLHAVLKDNPGVRAHMQGPSGVPLTSQEYEALLAIFKEKGFDISTLPKLQKIDFLPNLQLQNEKDVEIYLIEPFLKRLGYQEVDWIRQFPVRMGRGERNYPDYIIGSKQSKSEQSAKLVIEAKYRISSRKQLAEAFFQVSSYALRLQSKLAAVASFEGFWISEFKNGIFDMEKAIHKDWNELQNPDHFHQIKLLIGKGEIK